MINQAGVGQGHFFKDLVVQIDSKLKGKWKKLERISMLFTIARTIPQLVKYPIGKFITAVNQNLEYC